MWQEREGGPLVPAKSKHPWENRSFWRNTLRPFALRRDPICVICNRNPSTRVDHIIPFIAADGTISWKLFADNANHRALCESCHNRVTSTFDHGFGNPRKEGKANEVMPTGDGGRQFASSSIPIQKLNDALNFDVAAFLKDIPE